MKKTAIQPTRRENFPEWYQQVIKEAGLAENSASRGCMVIKPHGYGIWENLKDTLDGMLKQTGHVNAYFPSLIPLSFLKKEAEHIDGFAKECAVITHHRLETNDSGELVPSGELEEPYILRPTSETIIGDAYSKWVQSYRDLPILINQWANVFRWEMRPRLFLRTAEFLWQEGHTVHATDKEAVHETMAILSLYEKFVNEYLAIPVIPGKKTPDEKFPGAKDTYTIEAMMQDGKAVQAGTSHFLGQNFSKSSNIKFQNKDGLEEFAWTTSWGVSTRLIGAMIMVHSDDNGLVIPPKVAPQHVVIQPIYKNDEDRDTVLSYCNSLLERIRSLTFANTKVKGYIDDRDIQGGAKSWDNIKKGIPIRLEIGMRDISESNVCMKRRDKPHNEKEILNIDVFIEQLSGYLCSIQDELYSKAKSYRDSHIAYIEDIEKFKSFFSDSQPAGFALVPWCPSAIDHELLKELKVTPRCIPLDKTVNKELQCIFTGETATELVYFARAY
ncbi:proline--tRNA ligase [Vibrio lentus]|uniref:proline--tRNA ligase n=1 Tax=Vibrio lentus TaxID=136468 RepID=UPI002468944F|nr:proline--tRNA ligase [Vibrio lentus]MDH5929531.1 proline--tRNA ligase [Vibrio lentus]